MLQIVQFRLSIFLITIFFALYAALSQAGPMSPVEQAQVFACRATGSLLLLRGEGFQDVHQERLDQDIRDLENASQQAATKAPQLITLTAKLVEQLRAGVAYGPNEDKMPWRYPQSLAQALRELLIYGSQQPLTDPAELLPAKVEYLTVQYLSSAYFGRFEIAREQPDSYPGQDERKLVPDIDQQLSAYSASAMSRLKTRWAFMRVALLDMNSQSNAGTSNSGRAFAPITVDHHARLLTTQWMSINQLIEP